MSADALGRGGLMHCPSHIACRDNGFDDRTNLTSRVAKKSYAVMQVGVASSSMPNGFVPPARLAQVPQPAQTVLMADVSREVDGQPPIGYSFLANAYHSLLARAEFATRHNNRANVLFAAGHVRNLRAEWHGLRGEGAYDSVENDLNLWIRNTSRSRDADFPGMLDW